MTYVIIMLKSIKSGRRSKKKGERKRYKDDAIEKASNNLVRWDCMLKNQEATF